MYGLVVKRERKRHPRARGGKRVQEAKARKATKEAARLARLAEEESRTAEGATSTAEEAPSCTAAEEAVDVVEDAPATHAEGGEVEHAEATSSVEVWCICVIHVANSWRNDPIVTFCPRHCLSCRKSTKCLPRSATHIKGS